MFKLSPAPDVNIGREFPEQPPYIRDFLYSLLLDFIPQYADDIISITVVWPGERHVRSALLGESIHPQENYPHGLICLYPDAVRNFCEYSGIDMTSYMVSTFFHEVQHWLDTKKHGTLSHEHRHEEKAEVLANRVTKKLYNRHIIKQDVGATYDTEALSIIFSHWVVKWTDCKDFMDWRAKLDEIQS